MREFRARLDVAIDALTEAFETGLMSDAKSSVHAVALELEYLVVPVDEFAIIRSYVNAAVLALSSAETTQERSAGALRELTQLVHYLTDEFGRRDESETPDP